METRLEVVRWRLIQEEECSPAWNMGADEAILEAVAAGMAQPTLRLYRWHGPAVTIGRFQDASAGVDLQACRGLGVPVLRRPTGGRGVLHGGDQTLSLALPAALLGPDGESVVRTYTRLSAAFVAAFARLGISTEQAVCGPRSGAVGDCFAARTRADVVGPDGEKLIGCAMRRTCGVVLAQCSVRHERPTIGPDEVFRGAQAGTGYPLADVPEEELCEALVGGFAEVLGAGFGAGCLTLWEEERAAVLAGRLMNCALVDTPKPV